MNLIKGLFTFKSIRKRLTFLFLIVALIPLFIGLLITFNQRKAVIEEETFNKLTAIRDLKTQQLKYWVQEREADITVISEYSEISGLENILEKINKSPEDLKKIVLAQNLMSSYLRHFNDYEEIFIIGATNGLVEISSNDASVGLSKANDVYFTNPMKTKALYLKDVHYSPISQEQSMAIAIPIFSLNEKTKIIGIFVARINLKNTLYPLLLNRVGLGKTGETLIVNEEGLALNELRWYENAPLNLNIKAEPALNAAQGKTGVTITTDYRGEKILAAYTYIPEAKWGFVVKQDLAELYERIDTLMKNFIVLFLVTTIIVFLVVFLIIKAITKPIVDINLTTQKIKDGDYSARNVIKTKDEIGSLAVSINQMAESVASRITIDQGVAIISETIIGKSSIQEFSTELLKKLMKISKANMSAFYILNEKNTEFEHLASIGVNKELLKPFNAKNPEGEFGNALAEQDIYYLKNIPKNTVFSFKTTAGDIIPKEIITIPIIVEDKVKAIISLINIAKFSNESYEALEKSWQAINLSYSELIANRQNLMLAEDLSKLNNNLKAQSEELQMQTTELQRSSEELKEQNIELEIQKNQLNEASKLKTTFLSNMSHELRTPLNSVIGLSGVLSRKLVNLIPEEEYNYISVIERNGKHLLSLINNILDISRVEAGHEDIEISKFNVNKLIAELVFMLQPQAKHKNIKLTQTNSDVELLLTNDIGKCKQILQNLISNAVKFTDKGKVEIKAKRIKDTIEIKVCDTGIGIAKEMLPNIFDEFRQADDSTSRRFEGTGLGLAIVEKYSKLLGGVISVKSTSGKGSEFTLTLPLFHAPADSIISTSITDAKLPIKNTDYKSAQDSSTKTILLVEDSESAIIQIKDILEESGYNILVARNGVEALEIINHTVPDGMILDLMMPLVDGFEVLSTLREVKITAHVPVLILTAKHITKEELKFLTRNNVHQLIQKGDIKKKELLSTISGMISQKDNTTVKSERILQNIKGKAVVLIVEDNPDNMITVKALLSNNYTIIEAINGKEGVDMAKKHLPNLILMDIALPKMDGFEAFTGIRTLAQLQHIPIIALTASAMAQDRETILAYGFDAYITKPIDETIFYKTIEEILYGK